MLTIIVISLVIIIDQCTKYMVRINFEQGETLPIISDILHLTYVRNLGAAFSMFENIKVVTIIMPLFILLIAITALFFFYKRISRFSRISISLIIAGGMSNLIDRIILGYVTDMIDFRIFPVFNIADISVCVGCMLLIVGMFLPEKLDKDNLPEQSNDW